MGDGTWLIEEGVSIDRLLLPKIKRGISRSRTYRDATIVPNLAVRIHDIVINDTKKWFGKADIRLDVLVVHGHCEESNSSSFYTPETFRFSGISDGNHLPIDDSGLLVFYGKPLHFLDISIMASRDRKNSDDLARLILEQSQSADFRKAAGKILSLAVAAPHVTIITAAIEAATLIGNFAYQILQFITGNTIGLYRASWLEHLDNFGIGRHPKEAMYEKRDLSFWYEIVQDVPLN